MIAILYGLSTPAILREQEDGTYIWIGDAYIHGVMKGEAVVDPEKGLYQEEVLTLL